jgi:UDP-N-acetylmuramyl pentapeptide phosphotransferase/UDP-N-acetylglucosamine-1-phosphate transferase
MLMLYIIVFLLSCVLTWRIRVYAIRKSIMDIPNDRSSHTIPTPRGGGLALAIAWFAGLIYMYGIGKIDRNLFYALFSGLPLTLIGFADDIFNLKPAVRFLVQFVCAGLALFFLKGMGAIEVANLNLHFFWLCTLLAFIAIIWSVNLFNFLDGIDGYISLEVIFIGFAVFLLTGDSLGILLASATLGFLCWNWQKAKIFMGDVGSTLLGFTVAVLAIFHQNMQNLHIPVWLILTSVFWFDATITLFRRVKNKESLSQAHRKHAYQRIVQWGFSHQKTTLLVFVLNLLGLGLAWLAKEYQAYDCLFLGLDLVLLFVVLRWIDFRKPFEYDK